MSPLFVLYLNCLRTSIIRLHMQYERRVRMKEIVNLNRKRVCDISVDNRTAIIRKKDCITKIIARADGTLEITHERVTLKTQ